MDAILTKKSIYGFNEDKYTKIPNKVFDAMEGLIIFLIVFKKY